MAKPTTTTSRTTAASVISRCASAGDKTYASLNQPGERLPDETVELGRKNAVGVCELAQVHEERRPFLVPCGVAGLLSRQSLEIPDVPLSLGRRSGSPAPAGGSP